MVTLYERINTHVDGTRENLALSQHGEPVREVSHVVFRSAVVDLHWFVTLAI